jgi:hypothetical protein
MQEIYHTELVVPSYLKWSETVVAYDRADYPDHIPQPGAYPHVVAPLLDTKRVHRVLMDTGSSLNIIYMPTLDSMRIQRSQLHLSSTLFHRVVPEMEAVPLRKIDLPVTFGVIYLHAIKKDDGYIHATKNFVDTCMPRPQLSLTHMPFRPPSVGI